MDTKTLIKERLNKGLMELDEKKIVAGVLIKCVKTNNIFLLFRNDKTPVWALVSGGIEKGENVLDGLKREIYEELFIKANKIQFKFVRIEQIPEKNMEFHYYEGLTNNEFKPILDHENLNFGWFPKDKLPTPLFKGLAQKIAAI
jgi:ADP-ribose pyrophosphatase YjhB (NUDIX family)